MQFLKFIFHGTNINREHGMVYLISAEANFECVLDVGIYFHNYIQVIYGIDMLVCIVGTCSAGSTDSKKKITTNEKHRTHNMHQHGTCSVRYRH